MKAVAIIGLIFSGLAIFAPVIGIFLAIFCSLLALISFRSQPTLSGITFGINIVHMAFLTPSIIISDVVSSSAENSTLEAGDLYMFYVGIHVVLFVIAVIWRLLRGATSQQKDDAI